MCFDSGLFSGSIEIIGWQYNCLCLVLLDRK